MQYSSEFIMQMRNHFSQLSEKEKAIFAGAEAMKHGEKGPQIAGEILGCSYATVSSGLEMIASRGIKKSATVISEFLVKESIHPGIIGIILTYPYKILPIWFVQKEAGSVRSVI